MSKRLGGIIDCKGQTSSWHLNGFPDGTVVTLSQQYNIGEKPTVILYTSGINPHTAMLFLTFSVIVANPKKLLYMVANPARDLLNREKRTKR